MDWKKCFVVLSVTALLGASAVYQWTDENGVIHFTDKPQQGAKKIDVREPSSIMLEEPIRPPQQQPSEVASFKRYKSVKILQPEYNLTIRNNQGLVAVAIVTSPELREEDAVQIYIDGNPAGPAQKGSTFSITGIERGSHALSVKIVGKEGKVLGTSNRVPFFMHRPRVNMVPQGQG